MAPSRVEVLPGYESRDHDGNALHTEATRVSFHVDGLDPETAAEDDGEAEDGMDEVMARMLGATPSGESPVKHVKLTLVKGDMDDWYTIERAEHDGREWFDVVTLPDGIVCESFQCSSRISDACVEGYAEEMRAIAAAIESGTSVEFKRCAVQIRGPVAEFWSPRNSRNPGITSTECAKELAAEIRRVLG